MTDTIETPGTPQEPPKDNAQPPAEAKKTEQEQMIPKSRFDEVNEAKKRAEQQLLTYQQAEQERTKTAMTAEERAKAAETEAAQLKFEKAQRTAADNVGLPAAFADRLKGATPEELETDAKKLLESMPKVQTAPKLPVTNPQNAETVETEAQKRERLFGKQTNVFDIDAIKSRGGGVVYRTPPE